MLLNVLSSNWIAKEIVGTLFTADKRKKTHLKCGPDTVIQAKGSVHLYHKKQNILLPKWPWDIQIVKLLPQYNDRE